MSDIRETLRRRVNERTKTFETGNWIEPGANYVFEVNDIKVFSGHKSQCQGVVEFTVESVTPTQAKEWYEKRGKWPNQPGSTVSVTYDLMDDYLSGLFVGVISKIVNEPAKELLKPAGDKNNPEKLTYEELVRIGDAVESSVCKGLKVRCEAFPGMNQSQTKEITKTKWSSLPAPEGHPLAEAINAR